MCAINGLWNENEAAVAAMNARTRHRGPDATGVWSNGMVTLGANRLAIIDLSESANQPLTSASGRYTIVFNGEIYNYQTLKKECASYPFKTQGDTEVILALFEQYKLNALEKLHGMFALAVWDTQEEKLILARDRSGIKPLYYTESPSFAFSSELKGLLGDGSPAIDHVVLARYLRMRYVAGNESIISGIKKLPPGCFAEIKNGKVASLTSYVDVPLQPLHLDSMSKIEDEVRSLIDASVKEQLVSDRPLGVFLSGGLDSTIVLDAAVAAGQKPQTFSVGFALSEGEDPAKFNTDAVLAKQTAAHYGTEHHETILTEEDFLKLLPDAVYYLDEPIANATAIAQLALSKFAREHVVVALSGEGGDELFGGYPRYRLNVLMDYWQRMPVFVRRACEHLGNDFATLNTPRGIERIERFMFEKDAELGRVVPRFSPSISKWFEDEYLTGRGEADFTQLFMDADRRSWLVDEALQRADTMTMAASLEARVPLLSESIVAYASRIPSSKRVSLLQSKRILRSAFGARLPQHVLTAPKRGFFSPTAKWLRRKAVLALVREVLSPGYHAGTDALLNFKEVETMLDAHVSKKQYAMTTLWTLVAFRMWAKRFNAQL